MRVYKIITDMTLEESENIDKILSEEDGELIKSLNWDTEIFSWDHEEGGNYVPYLICEEGVMDLISDLCNEYGFVFGPIDITEEFLMGLHKIPDSDFDDYRRSHLNEDIVYAKIAKLGVDSLDEVDKYILHNI